MQHLSKIPFHPLLFAFFPTLALYAYNIHEVSSSVLWRPLAISLVAAALLLGILRLIFRDWHRAAFFASVLLIIFFSYGRIYDALNSTSLVDLNIVRHRYLVIVFLCLFILLAWLTLRYLRDCKPVSGLLNIISIVMVILAGTQIASYLINTSSGERATARWSKAAALFPLPDLATNRMYISLFLIFTSAQMFFPPIWGLITRILSSNLKAWVSM